MFNYKEPSTQPYLPDSERGWNGSIAGGASYLGASDLYLAAEASTAFGSDRYNGAYLNSPTTPLQSTTSETIMNVDGKVGKGFAFGDMTMLIPYLELGYRYWGRNLGGGQVEDYQNLDALGGLMLQVSPMSKLTLSAYGSAGTTFAAEAISSPDTFHLGDFGVYKVGGKAGYDLTQKVEVFTTFSITTISVTSKVLWPVMASMNPTAIPRRRLCASV